MVKDVFLQKLDLYVKPIWEINIHVKVILELMEFVKVMKMESIVEIKNVKMLLNLILINFVKNINQIV